MAAKKTTRNTRTRTENRHAADEVISAVGERETTPVEEQRIALNRASALKASTEGLTVDAAVKKLTDVSLGLSTQVQAIQTQLAAEINKLNEVKETKKLLEEEIVELHQKDILATELKALVTEHQAKVAEIETAQAALEASQREQEAAYEKENQDYETSRNVARNREEQEYKYKLDQARRLETDQYNQNKRTRDIADAERLATFNKDMAIREAALKAAEQELNGLRSQVAAFPDQLKKAEDKAAAIVGNTLKKEHANEVTMLHKDAENAAKLAKMEADSLRAQIENLTQQVAEAKKDVKDAQTQVQAIAAKAVDGASGQAALAALQNQDANRNGGATLQRPAKG